MQEASLHVWWGWGKRLTNVFLNGSTGSNPPNSDYNMSCSQESTGSHEFQRTSSFTCVWPLQFA